MPVVTSFFLLYLHVLKFDMLSDKELNIKGRRTGDSDAGICRDEDCQAGNAITKPFSPSDIKISNPPMNMGDLIDMIQYGWVDFEADYQREDNLWDSGKQSRLIESALLGLRLPAFYFEEVSKKKWRIIDGLQRCSSIRNFCVDKTLTLQDLEFLDFNGVGFDSFDFELRRDLRMLPITVNVLQPGVPDEVKYILFKRLNTGGVNLMPQEIRNSMFRGRAIDMVKRLAACDEFRRATEYKIPSKRKQDQDFVSRFMSFYLIGYKFYLPDLEGFINSAMTAVNNGGYSKETLERMYDDFVVAMRMARNIFGGDAFRKISDHKRGPINKALFEVVSVTFARLSPEQRARLETDCASSLSETLKAEFDSNPRFTYALSTTTGRADNVKIRFHTFENMVKKLLDNDQNS